MPLIECTAGAASPNIAGDTYVFTRDRHGRFVCRVDNYHHVMCLISVEHYRLAEDKAAQATPEIAAVTAAVNSDGTEQPEPPADNQASQDEQTSDDQSASGTQPEGQNEGQGEGGGDGSEDDGEPSEPEQPQPDDLTKISGIGATIASRLNDRGFTTFAQIAALTEEQIKELDSGLGLKGGIERNEWIEQATRLAAKASQE
jgi:predicted flap endonuclease-1-like 5' DNA nuclease